MEALKEIAGKENQAVSAVGYLLGVKQEGKESTNCHLEGSGDRDFHLWLAASPVDSRAASVVVEVTPRIRAKHAAWSLKNLKRFVRQRSKVRVSGWLMLDPEHPEQLGLTRKTLWELHPILRLEIWSGGKWVEL